MNVTVVVETGLFVKDPKKHWWSSPKHTSFDKIYRRTFTVNPYARDANDIRVGETINLNPDGDTKLLLEVKGINHIDKDNIELVVFCRHWMLGGSMADNQKMRAKHDVFITRLLRAGYKLAPDD